MSIRGEKKIPMRLCQGLIAGIAILFFASVIAAKAGSITYVHDDLNRLIRIYYDDGKIIEYTYDNAGNRVGKTISQVTDTIPLTTTASKILQEIGED